ncbi:MAG: CehA/McbA family metallohydrolase [Acidobacteriota bacterium]
MHRTLRSYPARPLLAGALGLCLVAATLGSAPAEPQPGAALRWYKGNTHTHTLNSDGDSTPDDVVRWYREHAYQFLVLTDHNFLTEVDGLNALHGADEKFLVIKGDEVSSVSGGKPVHVCGLNVDRRIVAQTGSSVVEVLQRSVDAIRGASGVPAINHPNFEWALTTEDLRQVRNDKLFEIFNGHPTVNNLGGGGVPGLEDIWDRLLSSGSLIFGIAVDDAHTFKQPGNPMVAGPGRGWIMVRAAKLDPGALLDAMERGDFYASTGVVLEDFKVTAREMTVTVKAEASSKYRIQFIGQAGKVLREVPEGSATYAFTGEEGYVRARVIESNGRMAWCQPTLVRRSSAAVRLGSRLMSAVSAGLLRLWA